MKKCIISGETFDENLQDGDIYIIKTLNNGNFQWLRKYELPNNEVGYSIIQTKDGGYLITGQSYSEVEKKGDMLVIKTNQTGSPEWTNTYGDAQRMKDQTVGFSGIQTSDGGFIITGFSNTQGAGDFDIYLLKISSNGEVEWDNTFGGTDTEESFSLAQTIDGGYIIAGRTESQGAGGSDVYLIKTNGRGEKEWEKTYGGAGNDVGRSVAQVKDNGYIIGGGTNSKGDGGDDMYLIKTDSNGFLEWDHTYGGVSQELGYSVVQAPDGGYVIVGQTTTFGAGGTDVYVIKTDDKGKVQ